MSSHSKYAIILSSMSPEFRQGFVSYISSKGSAALGEAEEASDSNVSFLSVVDYIDSKDFQEFWSGFSALILAGLRMPRFDASQYASILTNAFSLPSEVAAGMAARIETADVLNPGGNLGKYDAFKLKLKDAFRRIYDPVASKLGFDAIGQNQEYDVDFLYELKLLGRSILELNSRTRLMSAQTMLQSRYGLMAVTRAAGDVMEGDPDDIGEVMIGDALMPLVGAPIPSKMQGGLASLFRFGKLASAAKVANVVGSDSQGKAAVNKKGRGIANVLSKIGQMKTGPLMLLAGGLGLGTGVISQLLRKKGDPGEDSFGDVVESIGDAYDSDYGDAYESGDIDQLAYLILRDAFEGKNDIQSGDPDIPIDMANAMGDISESDADDADAETGGLFQAWRTRRLRRKAGRRRRRASRRAARRMRKERKNDAFIQAKNAADAARYEDGSAEDYDPDDAPTDEETYSEEASSDAMPDFTSITGGAAGFDPGDGN